MERSNKRNGTDRITINVTAWERGGEAKVFRANSHSFPRLYIPIHHGYQLQNIAGLDKNRDTAPIRRSHQFEGLLQLTIEQLDREAQR